jgi:predicted RNase H-like HicB family nuclease
MKEYYIAAFVPEQAGNFSVYFPDIPGCVTGGYTLAECVEYGEDIFREMLLELVENKKPVPAPSDMDKAREMVKALRAEAGLPYPEDTVYQLFAAPKTDDVPVRVTISLPKSLLEQLDRTAKEEGFTRSGFLAHAAQQLCAR